jgi:hypothetical protein
MGSLHVRWRVVVPAFVALGALIFAGAASADPPPPAISSPNLTAPVLQIAGDTSGRPLPTQLVGDNFPATTQIFAEICDGNPSTVFGWSPTTNCDLASSGSPESTDGSGHVVFPTTDVSQQPKPFLGLSPQALFNCLAPNDPIVMTPGFVNGQSDPNNFQPDWDNCQIRLSTSNTTTPVPQAMVTMQLPNIPASATPVASFVLNQAGSFGVQIASLHAAVVSSHIIGGLQAGLTFTDTGNGTGTISGTPTAAGSKMVTIDAHTANGDVTQHVEVIVGGPPVFTSLPTAVATVGKAAKITVAAKGAGSISDYSAFGLPPGLTLTSAVNGSGLITGTPLDAAFGTDHISITANNLFGSTNFTLTLTVGSGKPGGVANVALTNPSTGDLHVAWTQTSTGASPITSYTITAKNTTTLKSYKIVDGSVGPPVVPAVTHVDFTSLPVGTYNVTIVASNVNGAGPLSPISTLTTTI